MSNDSELTPADRADLSGLLDRAREDNVARNQALANYRAGLVPLSAIARFQDTIDSALADAKDILKRCASFEDARAIVTEIENLAHGG